MSFSLTPIIDVTHPCVCPRCGKQTSETYVLPSNRHIVMDCGMCHTRIIGLRFQDKCPRCSSYGPHMKVADIQIDDPIPGNLCPHCR